jgi:hypothetical protein
MAGRRLKYPALAAACLLSAWPVAAQEAPPLRAGVDLDPDPIGVLIAADGLEQEQPPVPPPPKPTSLEVNPPEPEEEALPVPRRPPPEIDPYEQLGMRFGGLIAYPRLGIGGVATDNVGGDNSNRKSDIGVNLRPALRVLSDWVRHEYEFTGYGDFDFYADESDNDKAEADVRSRLRLDVRRGTTLTLQSGYNLSQEGQEDSDVPDTAIGDRTDHRFDTSAALAHQLGRIETRLTAGAALQLYEDVDLQGGGKEDNSDRDYVEPSVALRLGYEISPALRPFVEAAYEPRRHFETPDRNGLDRDSDGLELRAGVAFEPSPIWSGELALDYLLRDYDDPALDTIDAFGLSGNIVWRPSALTTVTFTADTSLDETSDPASSGSRNYSARVDVDHDLREYLTISAGTGVEYEDFQGIDQNELILRARTGMIWRLNNWMAWTLDYDFFYSDSSLPATDYYENRVTAGIELRR